VRLACTATPLSSRPLACIDESIFIMELLTTWKAWQADTPPFILDEDRQVLSSQRSRNAIRVFDSWREAYSADDFCALGDTKLHLGLIPQPFIGNLLHARIILLLLNPGLGPTDYYGEYEIPQYRSALLANLSQDFTDNPYPFLFLNPKFSWHGGFDWWHSKLAKIINELAQSLGTSFAIARKYLSSEIASIELLPYHSSSFHDADKWIKRLTSADLARKFVHDVVLERVRSGESVLIVTRKAREWDLPTEDGIVIYNSAEARAAHLTPGSRGGKAILEFLLSGKRNY